MINKISNSRIGAYSVIPQNKTKGASSIPNFGMKSDAFVRTIAEKDVPIPVTTAISHAMEAISSKDFGEFEQAILNEGSAGIKNLYLKAKKINENKINLKIVYENDEGKGDGGFILTSGSVDAVSEEVKNSSFMTNLREKLVKASDGEIYRPTKKLED